MSLTRRPRVLWEDATARVVRDEQGGVVPETWAGKDAMGVSRWIAVSAEVGTEILLRAILELGERDPEEAAQ